MMTYDETMSPGHNTMKAIRDKVTILSLGLLFLACACLADDADLTMILISQDPEEARQLFKKGLESGDLPPFTRFVAWDDSFNSLLLVETKYTGPHFQEDLIKLGLQPAGLTFKLSEDKFNFMQKKGQRLYFLKHYKSQWNLQGNEREDFFKIRAEMNKKVDGVATELTHSISLSSPLSVLTLVYIVSPHSAKNFLEIVQSTHFIEYTMQDFSVGRSALRCDLILTP